ncbi:MAG: hypothetical protein RR459_05255, partial [Christensenellaceae bacterium]
VCIFDLENRQNKEKQAMLVDSDAPIVRIKRQSPFKSLRAASFFEEPLFFIIVDKEKCSIAIQTLF